MSHFKLKFIVMGNVDEVTKIDSCLGNVDLCAPHDGKLNQTLWLGHAQLAKLHDVLTVVLSASMALPTCETVSFNFC